MNPSSDKTLATKSNNLGREFLVIFNYITNKYRLTNTTPIRRAVLWPQVASFLVRSFF